MLKAFRRKHSILFCLGVVVVCWVIGLKCAGLIERITLGRIGLSDRMEDGASTIFCDGLVLVIAFLILWATDRLAIVGKKGAGFFKGLAVAAVPLSISCLGIVAFVTMFLVGSTEIEQELGLHPVFDAASVATLISFFFVGITEEMTLRGIVAETLLEHFGTSRDAIWKAVVISGVMFGVTHTINLFVASPVYVVGQVVSAAGGGILYAAIYFRAGNIWVVALVHALHDIMASSVIWLGGATTSSALSMAGGGPSLFPYAMAVVETLIAVFLLRKKKIGQVAQSWPELEQWHAE